MFPRRWGTRHSSFALVGAGVFCWLLALHTCDNGPLERRGGPAEAIRSNGPLANAGARPRTTAASLKRPARSEVSGRARGTNMSVPAPSEASAEQAVQGKLDEDSPVPTLAEETASFGAYFERLDARRAREGPDPDWGNVFVQAARSAMETLRAQPGLFAASSIAAVDCGRTLCRLEIQNDDDGAARLLQGPLIARIGEAAPSATAYVVPGTGRAVFYFARAGSDLPSRHDDAW